jgi:hypothetical protein
MSWVESNRTCPQCEFKDAQCHYNCRNAEEFMKCGLCGYFEAVKASHGEDGKFVGYVHEVRSGAGALFYHYQGAPGYRTYCLHSEEEVAAAERWLSDRLSLHQVQRDTAYLTRWLGSEKTVVELIGRIHHWTILEKLSLGEIDLRPFRIANNRKTRSLNYSCGHSGPATILVLEKQRIPDENQAFTAFLPCPACEKSGAARKQHQVSGARVVNESTPSTSLVRCWENLVVDGTSDIVTPAFDHPPDLASASSMFYAAFPDRKIFPPESVGFQAQLTGRTDEDIRDKKWL